MLNRLIDKTFSKVSGPVFLIAIVIFMVFILLVLPNESERSEKYFKDSPAPDSSFLYSGEDLYRMAENFGAEGRAYYIRSRFTFDIVWPLAYGLFLCTAMVYLGRRLKHTKTRYLILLPILGVLLDYMENTGASLVMLMYPARVPILPHIVPIFTTAKWLSIGAGFIALLLLIIYRGIAVLKSK